MNLGRSVIVNLVGGLDNNGNCEVGMFKVNGVPLRSQVVTAAYEIYIRQEWARANNLTGSIKLLEYLMGTTTDRMLMDSGRALISGTTRKMPALNRWSACTGAASRCSPTRRLLSWMAPPCVRQRQEPGGWTGVEGDHDTVQAGGQHRRRTSRT
jgi:hypothetical protein